MQFVAESAEREKLCICYITLYYLRIEADALFVVSPLSLKWILEQYLTLK
jgi:hypothetical protein